MVVTRYNLFKKKQTLQTTINQLITKCKKSYCEWPLIKTKIKIT